MFKNFDTLLFAHPFVCFVFHQKPSATESMFLFQANFLLWMKTAAWCPSLPEPTWRRTGTSLWPPKTPASSSCVAPPLARTMMTNTAWTCWCRVEWMWLYWWGRRYVKCTFVQGQVTLFHHRVLAQLDMILFYWRFAIGKNWSDF